MAVTVEISASYDGDPDDIFRQALTFADMENAMRGMATYAGLPVSGTAAEGSRFIVDVTFWGLVTVRGHQIFVERLDVANRVIQSREQASGVRRWDHHLSVQPHGEGSCWTDSVVIDAGWKTWFVARFAAYIYARRHRYRKARKIERRLRSS